MALDTSPHALYEYQPSFILGFHGCDKETGERILDGEEPHLKPSEKDRDWPIYEGAGFRSHTHIQICVRELACVKGYFRPLASVL